MDERIQIGGAEIRSDSNGFFLVSPGVMRRAYLVDASISHWTQHEGLRVISTDMRSRHAVVVFFRKWFGREPGQSWGDGSMAEAWDRLGNKIQLIQAHYK